MVHQAGARYGYIITSAMIPLVPPLLGAGVDMIIGVDAVQGKGTDLVGLKGAAAGRIALWGGVNGFLIVELGTAADVVAAADAALAALAPGGGFILCPVDGVRADTARAWANVRALIDACHTIGRYA